ncbi:MAG: YHS domain-containing protein [Saprospiraceae bacterium]|nr:YHS domain-containing protein [Saprospiraceae bacterium]
MTRIAFFSAAIFFFANCGHKAPQTTANAPATAQAGLPWAGDVDLVCEMKVDQTTEDTAHYAGKVYGFCNPHCKDEFKANPAKYVGQ